MSSPVEADALLAETLIAAGRAPELGERLRILAGALATVAAGAATVVVRDESMGEMLAVRAAPGEVGAPASPAAGGRVSAAVWRRWLRLLKARRGQLAAPGARGALYALDLADPWARAEFGHALATLADPAGLLLAPLVARDGAVVATLVLEVPDAWPPNAAVVRAAELLGQQMAQHVAESRLESLAARRAERLQRLQEAGAALARSLDEQEIVRELARQVTRLVKADGIVVAHPDLEAGVVHTALR